MPEALQLAIPERLLTDLAAEPDALKGIRRGLEKESLRVGADGVLSTREHPAALGSTLTHPQITTDFSEAQLELITGVHDTPEDCMHELLDIHRYVYHVLGPSQEFLWAASMPCLLIEDDEIPIGRYGASNIGMAKTVYRRGLAHRYGRRMQTISGIHYNFSVPDAFWPVHARLRGADISQAWIDAHYFGLIRNVRRYGWLLIYLFGASPAVCGNFTSGLQHALAPLGPSTLHLPDATSLRMGRLGYQSDAQASLHVSYNSLASYADTLHEALTRPYPPYEAIGVRVNGVWRQLNSALLQIENEFYGTVRPKRRILPGERPLTALRRRGVEYVEVRCLDINPFLPLGMDATQMRFLDAFLLTCLLADSRPDSPEESRALVQTQTLVVEQGRDPGLALPGGRLRTLARQALRQCQPVARLLDTAHGGNAYMAALSQQQQRVEDASLTPSGQILDALQRQESSFFHWARSMSEQHQAWFQERPLAAGALREHERRAQASLLEHERLEAEPRQEFAEFLAAYLAPPG